MITRLPLPEFMPDQTIASGVLTVCENAIPSADDSYRPLRALSTLSDPLDETFNGGFSAISTDGTGYMLAGTATDLYKFSGGTWDSISDTLTVTERWKFVQFGNYVVSVNGADTQEIDLTGGTASVIAAAPSATSIAVVGDYVVIGQPDGANNVVAWSAFRDHTSWTLGIDQAGEQPMQTGGEVQGIAGGEYGVILQRERLVRMTRTGDANAPFQFDEISANFGCSHGATIAQAGRTIFFHSDRGFMALDDGQELRPIGDEKVDRSFVQAVGRDNFGLIHAAVDPENKLVMWGIPGSPGKIWIYHFGLNRWANGSLPFTGLMAGFTASTTLEELAVTYTNLDTMTISLDDSRWSGGAPRLYFFDTAGAAGTLTGETLAAQFHLSFGELAQGQRARVRSVRPVTDATEGVSVELDARLRLGDPENRVEVSTIRDTGIMPIRISGRFVAPALRYAAGTNWTYARGLEIDLQPGGAR